MQTSRTAIRALCVAMATLVLLAGCGGDDAASDPTGEWTLTEMAGAPPAEGTTITLVLEEDRASGTAGCNQYTGDATWSDGTFEFTSAPAATMMACPEPAGSQEQVYLETLASVTSWTISDEQLELSNGDGEVVLRYE